MPQQREPPSEEEDDEVVLHTIEQVREYLTQQGVPPELHARALLGNLDKQEHSGTAGLTSSTDDHCVEDDASDDSTGKG